MCEWLLTILNNDERNIKLDQTKFIDKGPLSGDSKFNSGN